jgi:hypothetical protein
MTATAGGSTADLGEERDMDLADVDFHEADTLDETDLNGQRGLLEDDLHHGKLADHHVMSALEEFKEPWKELEKKANRLSFRAGTWATSDYPVEEYLKKLHEAMELRTRILEKEYGRVKEAVVGNVAEALNEYDQKMLDKGGKEHLSTSSSEEGSETARHSGRRGTNFTDSQELAGLERGDLTGDLTASGEDQGGTQDARGATHDELDSKTRTMTAEAGTED